MHVIFGGRIYEVQVSKYENGRVSLILDDGCGDSIRASVNMPKYDMPLGCVAIKDWTENVGLLAALVDAGIVGPPITHVNISTWVNAPICKLLEIL